MPRRLTKKQIERFRQIVWNHYARHGRKFPWRQTSDPYKILVSEIMLQQTQTQRVLLFYRNFLRRFPNITTLARAPLAEVLCAWQGLGYNRRACALKKMAQMVEKEHGGTLPKDAVALRRLPGVGPYTAGAVRVFAYGYPDVCVETNIRTIFLLHFFKGVPRVPDKAIERLVAQTLDKGSIRAWYWALMDYGVFVKEKYGNQNSRSVQYRKQLPYEGSVRQMRGAVIRALAGSNGITRASLLKTIAKPVERVDIALAQLCAEGLVQWRGRRLVIARG